MDYDVYDGVPLLPGVIEMIKNYEGCRLTAYPCTAGVWTTGWGQTGTVDGLEIKKGLTITQETADNLFVISVHKFKHEIIKALGFMPNINQLSACVSLTYNIGIGSFIKSSVCSNMKAGNFDKAADAILLYNKVRNPKTNVLEYSEPHARRRERERKMFLGQNWRS